MAGKAAGKLSTARSDLSELRKSLSAGMGPRYAAPFRRRFCRAAGCIGQSAGADHALLLDRASISRQNGYVEPDGTIRLYFTLEQAQTKLHRSR